MEQKVLSKAVSNVITKVMVHQGFFASIIYDVCPVEETVRFPAAACDGRRILLNPDFFKPLAVDQGLFVVCHEVMHKILMHMEQGKHYMQLGIGPYPYIPLVANMAMDYVINDMLVKGEVGIMPSSALHKPDKYTYEMDWKDVYIDIMRNNPPPPPKGSGGDGDGEGSGGDEGEGGGSGEGEDEGGQPNDGSEGHGNFDRHIYAEEGVTEAEEAKMKRAVNSAANIAKAMGQLPASLEKFVDSILKPKVPWNKILEPLVRKTLSKDQTTWARPNKKMLVNQGVYMPGRTGTATGKVCIEIDTSGSVSMSETAQFLGETAAIIKDCNPEKVIILWVDAAVAHVDEMTNANEIEGVIKRILDKGVPGGGGTDMGAGIEWCEEFNYVPDTFICLTDGETPWGNKPNYPVIWGVTNENITAPYGETIFVEISDQ